jgi:PAS domain-containing protein
MNGTMDLMGIQDILFQLLKTIDCILWIHSLEENRLIYINPAYSQIWGELPGNFEEAFSTYLDSIHDQDKEAVFRIFNSPFQQDLTKFEYRIFDQANNLRWIQTRRYPIFNQQRSMAYVVDISSDISETKHIQIYLEKFRKSVRIQVEGLTEE